MTMRRLLPLLALLLAAAAWPAEAAARAAPTGRYLVVFERASTARSASSLSRVLSRAGVRRAGRGVPGLGVATVRGSRSQLDRLRRDPRVRSVSAEWARELRRTPNDVAVRARETAYGGIPGGGPIQWALARQNFYPAFDITTGAGARLAVIDSGIDGGHPELASKVLTAEEIGGSNPGSDPEGHGTHVSGLACAATNNGIGVAGAGWGCRLHVIKLRVNSFGNILDEDVVAGIRRAADRGAQAINMSFGGGPPNAALDLAIDYAVRRGAVLVAAASNDPEQDQGAPASSLQPGDGPILARGRGLVVTSADFSDRRPGTGWGPQISVAAYGFYDETTGPPGLISTFPRRPGLTDYECVTFFSCTRRSLSGDNRYAYLQGTSMATPQVTALAALVANLNPFLTVRQKLTLIKQYARRSGGWNPDRGWGIIDAGRTVDAARRIDKVAPSSRARARRRVRIRRGRRRIRVRVRYSRSDPAGRAGLIPSGVRSLDLYMRRNRSRRWRRIRRGTRARSTIVRLRPGVYRFYTGARDRAGNLEARPGRSDARLVVKRAKRKKRRRR